MSGMKLQKMQNTLVFEIIPNKDTDITMLPITLGRLQHIHSLIACMERYTFKDLRSHRNDNTYGTSLRLNFCLKCV